MFRLLLVLFTAFLAFATLAAPSSADELSRSAGRYRVLPESVIAFRVGQMGGGGVSGTFPRFEGTFELDAELKRSQVDFTIDARDISAGDPRVGEFIRSKAVFNAEAYPAITFRSTKVTRTGDMTARIEGRLSARGLTRTVGFDVSFDGRDGDVIRFRVTGKMSRALFGMEIGTPIYSNMVEFDMALVGRRS